MIDIEGGEFLKSQGGQIIPISDAEVGEVGQRGTAGYRGLQEGP